MPELGFPRQARLTETDDFSSVFNFRKRISGPHLALYYRPNQLSRSRLGLIVGKKTARSSVRRNYMRRVLRELFRHQQSKLKNVDIVIRVHSPFYRSEYPSLALEFNELVFRLNR
ncbi:MAG TPA: ribonuclease P protein component [Methylophilaceae bacterium]|nr:ribonuclease P protein component [Methylophilaceae bacterium]